MKEEGQIIKALRALMNKTFAAVNGQRSTLWDGRHYFFLIGIYTYKKLCLTGVWAD